ncbi:MAG TPA: glycosyltransferase family 39 protein [Blastocatellia bacterium]|nr:glycosyltransferase family 39 protein [Blastocatellia bacterium]
MLNASTSRASQAASEHEADGRRPGLMRGSALPYFLTLAAGLICYGLFYNRGIWLSVIGYSVAPAERVMLGEVPYKDFLYNYTPGILWLNAALMRAFGPTLMTVSAGLFAFKLATLLLLYHISRGLCGVWAGLLVVALALAWIGWKYIFGVYPTQYSMLFVLAGLACMIRFDEGERSRWLFASGAAVGTVLAIKYNVGILLGVSGSFAVILRELVLNDWSRGLRAALPKALRRVAWFWLGTALVAACMFAYLSARGGLLPMLDHFFHFAGEYSAKRSVRPPSLKIVTPSVIAILLLTGGAWLILRRLARFYVVYLAIAASVSLAVLFVPARAEVLKASALASVSYLPGALFLIVLGLCLFQLRGSLNASEARRQWWKNNGVIIIVTMFAAGAYLEVFPRADNYHLVRALPPVFLLFVILMKRAYPALLKYTERVAADPKRAAALTLALPLVLLMATGFQHTWRPHFTPDLRLVDRSPVAVARARGMRVPPRQAGIIESFDSVIASNSAEGDEIFSFSQRGTAFYFLSERKNPTRFVWWRNVGISGDDRDSVLRMIEGRRPRLILLQDGLKDPRIRGLVDHNYQRVATVTDIGIYGRKD